jgi:uncharacterized protein (UPF0335 family)
MTIGRNTVSGEALAGFVDRIEAIRAQKKALGADETFVLAEAKQGGFVPTAIRHVVQLRAMKPHARQEAEAIRDQYLHALGMASDMPLFRQVGLMSVDVASRESVIEALKAFVPENGSIVIEAGGRPVRLTRDKGGEVTAAEVVDPPPGAESDIGGLARASVDAAAGGAGRRCRWGGSLGADGVQGKRADHHQPLPVRRWPPAALGRGLAARERHRWHGRRALIHVPRGGASKAYGLRRPLHA